MEIPWKLLVLAGMILVAAFLHVIGTYYATYRGIILSRAIGLAILCACLQYIVKIPAIRLSYLEQLSPVFFEIIWIVTTFFLVCIYQVVYLKRPLVRRTLYVGICIIALIAYAGFRPRTPGCLESR